MVIDLKIGDKVKIDNKIIGIIEETIDEHNIDVIDINGYKFTICSDTECEEYKEIKIIDDNQYLKYKTRFINKNINLDKTEICKLCNWPVIDILIETKEFSEYKNNKDFTSYIYCSNKCCHNHEGEGYFISELPSWVELI